MPRDGGTGGGYYGGGSDPIIPIKGTGAVGDPQLVHYERYDADFNVATTQHQIWRMTGVWVRIFRIHVNYSSATSGLTGVSIRPVMATLNDLGGGAQVIVLGNAKVTTATPWDGCDWDFGPQGMLFWVAPQNTVGGTPTGALALQHVGYAATDDELVDVLYEWGEWPG